MADGDVRNRTERRRGLPFTRQMLLLQVGVVLVLGLSILIGLAALMRSTLSAQYEQRALSVARAVAADRSLGDLVRVRDQPKVQDLAAAEQRATGALFVVITDDRGVRLAHPNPGEIGVMVSTDPGEPSAGREVAMIERGTLGLSARGKVPLRDGAGSIVGEVSVGFAVSEIDDALAGVVIPAGLIGAAAVLIGATLSGVLARRMKRLTFGLEPAEVADLVREREAVLFGIGEGVLAVDGEGRVTMSNTEANRLLDQRIEPGALLAEVAIPQQLRDAFGRDEDRQVIAISGARVLVANYRPVRLDGRDLGGVLTIRDRTDLEQLTSELAAVRTMTTALRAQRHEFANQMHAVSGLLQIGAVADAVEYLQASTQFTPGEQISDTAALQSDTLKAFLAAKSAYAAERGVQLQLSPASWVPYKLVAPVEVVTVLGNLVDNAVDAAAGSTARPARVEIDLLSDDGELVISVADTGDGFESERCESIFVDGMSSRGPGRGLGLGIARQTARGLGGDIRVTAADGAGSMTVFVAQLPNVLRLAALDGTDEQAAAVVSGGPA